MKQKPVGWKNDPYRHSLAARGVSTTLPYPRKSKGDKINEIEHVISNVSSRYDPYSNKHKRERGEVLKGEAAIKLQLVKQKIGNHWDDDFDAIHNMLARSMNSPNLPTRYTHDWIENKINDGTLSKEIIRLVNVAHPDLADISKTIIIHDFGGMLESVYNVPKGWDYEYFIINEDDEDDFDKLPKIRSKTIRVVYYEALPETIEGLPKGYDYAVYFDDS